MLTILLQNTLIPKNFPNLPCETTAETPRSPDRSPPINRSLHSFCCVFNSIISGTQFGRGLPRSAHAQAQSDSTVRHQTGHAQNEEALHQTESQILCYWKTQQKEWSVLSKVYHTLRILNFKLHTRCRWGSSEARPRGGWTSCPPSPSWGPWCRRSSGSWRGPGTSTWECPWTLSCRFAVWSWQTHNQL